MSFFAFGEDLLVLFTKGGDSFLLRYSGKILLLNASLPLEPGDWSVQTAEDSVCCYDSLTRRVFLTDGTLHAPRVLSLSEIIGAPSVKASGNPSAYPAGASHLPYVPIC